jgi:site-specific DNA-methyltransferase (adenine-specific)
MAQIKTSENGITLKHVDVFSLIKDIPDKSINMIFAGPPYNLSGAGFLTVKSEKPVACDKVNGTL